MNSPYVRAAVATALAGLTALGTAISDDVITNQEWVAIAIATTTAFGAWLGLGAKTDLEPSLNTKKE